MSYPPNSNSNPFDLEMSQLSQSLLAPQGPEDANVSTSSSFAVPQMTSTKMSSSQQSQFQSQSQVQSQSQFQSLSQVQSQSQLPMTGMTSSGYQSSIPEMLVPVVPNLTQEQHTQPPPPGIAEGMLPQNPDPTVMPPPEPTPHVPGSSFLPHFSSANSEVFRQKRGRGIRGGGGGGGLSRGGRGTPSSWRPSRQEKQDMENKKMRAENTELKDNIAWIRSELTNLPGKVRTEISSSLEQSEQPMLEEVCSLRSTVEETMASVEAVGRVVEDVGKKGAEGREELKRCVEEVSLCCGKEGGRQPC